MIEQLNNILFHPSTLINYRKTKLYKVLFLILFLSIFSILTVLIDTIKSPGFTISDKQNLTQVLSFDFSTAKSLPDCKIENSQFSCENEGNHQTFGKALRLFTLVTDVDNDMVMNQAGYYIKFTKDSIKITDRNIVISSIAYHRLPSKWHNIDFKEIKNSTNPEDELYLSFLGGLNQIVRALLPLDITVHIIVSFIFKILELLFFSFLFYLIYRKLRFKYSEVFKITAFAQVFAITIGVIFDLMRWDYFSSFIVTTITFIYVYIALYSNFSQPKEI